MGRAAEYHDERDRFKEGSLLAKFRDQFKFGRETLEDCSSAHGLMPVTEDGCKTLNSIFIKHIFYSKNKAVSWKWTAALSGVHNLGGAKVYNSGYKGMWLPPHL